MSKDNRVFLKKYELSLFIVLKITSIGVHKNIIYQHICMTKYILTLWSSFTPQCVPSYIILFSLPVKAAPHECVIRTGQP